MQKKERKIIPNVLFSSLDPFVVRLHGWILSWIRLRSQGDQIKFFFDGFLSTKVFNSRFFEDNGA